MDSYWASCKTITVNENSSASKNKQNRLILLSNCGKKSQLLLKTKKTTTSIIF